MPAISIIIPSRFATIGLWATVHSCLVSLERTGVEAEFIILTNGDEDLGIEGGNCIDKMTQGKAIKHVHVVQPLAPPVARQRAAALASNPFLFFFDDHCLPDKTYFERALLSIEQSGADMLHSSTIFFANGIVNYEYRLKLEYNFWGESATLPYSHKPYLIGAAGHGGFVVRKSVWDEVGGYGPEELFSGYGGEELLFDLKMWRLGKNNFIDPKLMHYHYAGIRGYSRHFTDAYYANLLVSALVIGGEKWMYKLFDSFLNKTHMRMNAEKDMYTILQEAYYRGATYAKELDSKSIMTLDELLIMFREKQVKI